MSAIAASKIGNSTNQKMRPPPLRLGKNERLRVGAVLRARNQGQLAVPVWPPGCGVSNGITFTVHERP
jgi:hypothetical protein